MKSTAEKKLDEKMTILKEAFALYDKNADGQITITTTQMADESNITESTTDVTNDNAPLITLSPEQSEASASTYTVSGNTMAAEGGIPTFTRW